MLSILSTCASSFADGEFDWEDETRGERVGVSPIWRDSLCCSSSSASRVDLPHRRQTCIFLDWDDTLLCTSFINTIPDGELTPAEELQLQSLGRSVTSLLHLARRLGHVWIITNAGEGWVEQSTAAFLPYVLSVLNEVPVVSARSRFEPTYPDDAFMWKKHAFLDVQSRLDTGAAVNLISVGDSLCEMLAVKAMAKEFEQACVKTVQFVACPTLEELEQQQQCLIGVLESIVDCAIDCDIDMSRCCTPDGFSISVPRVGRA